LRPAGEATEALTPFSRAQLALGALAARDPKDAARRLKIKAEMEARKAERASRAEGRNMASLVYGDWYQDEYYNEEICPADGDYTCWGAAFPAGPTICTIAGSQVYIDIKDNIAPPQFTIPPACLPGPGTTQDECTKISALWNTKFPYCCPACVSCFCKGALEGSNFGGSRV